MDDPSLPRVDHEHALRGLARINRFSRAAESLLPHIQSAAAGRTHLRLLDIATGSGDVPVSLAILARNLNIHLRLGLCDISTTALSLAAQRAAAAGVEATTHRIDIAADPLPLGYDIAASSLFLHHLSSQAVQQLLANMRRVTQAIVISDLRRSRAGTALAWAGSRLLSRSRVVHTDAVLSARSAWTIEELRSLAAQAGLDGAVVRPAHPCRMILTWNAR